MQRIDLLIGIALALAVVGSAIGVMTYEDDRLGALRVDWRTSEEEVESENALQTGAGEVELPLQVAAANISAAEVRVNVAGQAARVAPVAIRVDVVVPGTNESFSVEGELPAGPGASVDLVVPVTLRAVPTVDSVSAGSADAARAQLAAEHASTLGQGEWIVRVSLAPGAPGPLGAESFALQARATLTTYEAEVSVETPEVEQR